MFFKNGPTLVGDRNPLFVYGIVGDERFHQPHAFQFSVLYRSKIVSSAWIHAYWAVSFEAHVVECPEQLFIHTQKLHL